MREFFVLTHDDCDNLQAVSDYDMGDFDLTAFWSGKPIPGKIPMGVRVLVGDGDPSDYLGNPISWAILSEKFLRTVINLVGDDVQCFSAPLFHEQSRKPIAGYSVINVTRRLPALAKPLTSVNKMVLTADSIPLNAHIFRVVGHETLLLVSQDFKEELRGKKLHGIALIKTKCV